MGWTAPTEDEFDGWETPLVAVEELPWDEYTARRWLMDRLKTGVIIAVARTGNPSGRLHWFTPVLPSAWSTWSVFGDDHFWETGDATFKVSASTTGYGKVAVHYQDIRFDPLTLSGKPPATPALATEPEEAPEPAAPKPRLPDSLLNNWHTLFLKAYPVGSKRLAEESARGMFPDHHVSRDRIRDLFPHAPMGRPKKTGS